MTKNLTQIVIISGVCGFASGLISLWTILRWHQRRTQRTKSSSSITLETEPFHWNPLEERRGLGHLIMKVNHIAITVSNVGRSLNFYVDILGLQQIRRPHFDRHGAWLTMGNIELHLIKGIPLIPPIDNVQVGHISFETQDIDGVLRKLREYKIRYRQSLAIIEPQSTESKKKSGIVQYFISDPDGYFIEICNCDVLTDFCFNRKSDLDHVDYDEGVQFYRAFDVVQAMTHWKLQARKRGEQDLDSTLRNLVPAARVNEKKFQNLCQRRSTYGDITQGFTDQEIRQALLRTCNSAPLTIRILARKRAGRAYFQPVPYIENNQVTYPQPFTVNIHDFHPSAIEAK